MPLRRENRINNLLILWMGLNSPHKFPSQIREIRWSRLMSNKQSKWFSIRPCEPSLKHRAVEILTTSKAWWTRLSRSTTSREMSLTQESKIRTSITKSKESTTSLPQWEAHTSMRITLGTPPTNSLQPLEKKTTRRRDNSKPTSKPLSFTKQNTR